MQLDIEIRNVQKPLSYCSVTIIGLLGIHVPPRDSATFGQYHSKDLSKHQRDRLRWSYLRTYSDCIESDYA